MSRRSKRLRAQEQDTQGLPCPENAGPSIGPSEALKLRDTVKATSEEIDGITIFSKHYAAQSLTADQLWECYTAGWNRRVPPMWKRQYAIMKSKEDPEYELYQRLKNKFEKVETFDENVESFKKYVTTKRAKQASPFLKSELYVQSQRVVSMDNFLKKQEENADAQERAQHQRSKKKSGLKENSSPS